MRPSKCDLCTLSLNTRLTRACLFVAFENENATSLDLVWILFRSRLGLTVYGSSRLTFAIAVWRSSTSDGHRSCRTLFAVLRSVEGRQASHRASDATLKTVHTVSSRPTMSCNKTNRFRNSFSKNAANRWLSVISFHFTFFFTFSFYLRSWHKGRLFYIDVDKIIFLLWCYLNSLPFYRSKIVTTGFITSGVETLNFLICILKDPCLLTGIIFLPVMIKFIRQILERQTDNIELLFR